MGALSASLRAWIAPGLPGTLAIADGEGVPRIARIWVAQPLEDGDVLDVYVQESTARGVLEALDRPRRASLNLIEIPSYRSRAFKGVCERSLRDPDPTLVDEWLAGFARSFATVGLPSDAPQRMLTHGGDSPMIVLRLAVDSVFDQSPKPGAGARL